MTDNAVTRRFLDAIAGRGLTATNLLEPTRAFDMSDTIYLGEYLPRPTFLDRDQLAGLSADMDVLITALTGLPQRLFGGDLAAFARSLGMTEVQVDAVLKGRAATPSRLGRADIYADATGFKVLEINMHSALGGADGYLLNEAMLAHPFVAEFVAENNLGYVDTMAEIVDTLLTECKIPSGARPVVVIADWPASYPQLERQLRRNAATFSEMGLDAHACHVGMLETRDGRVWLDDKAVDVIFRLFMIEDLLEEGAPALLDPILWAVERGEVTLFCPMDSELYASKGALAQLSDEANRHLFSAEELAVLDRILPWTRMVRSGPVTVDGEKVDLFDHAIANQEELVLKPTLLHGGAGVVIGANADADAWRAELTSALDGPYVLQRRVVPVPELFPTDGEPQPWVLNWGVFNVSRGYGGSFMRGAPGTEAGVINAYKGGALATCCFHEQG